MTFSEYRMMGFTEFGEEVLAIDVGGKRHRLVALDASDLYDSLAEGGWDHNVWLRTSDGIVRYGALAEVLRP